MLSLNRYKFLFTYLNDSLLSKKRSSFKIGYRNDPPRVYILQKRKRKNSKRQTISLKYTFNIANISISIILWLSIFMKACRWRSWILFIPVRLLCLPLIHVSSISLVTSVRLDPWYFTYFFLYGAFFGSRGRVRTLSPLFLTGRQVDCSLTGIIRSTMFHNEYCSVRNTVIEAWRYCICNINGERQLTVHNLYRTYIHIEFFVNILDIFLINYNIIYNTNKI